MSKTLSIVPYGWPCSLEQCAPGHFVYNDNLCFKTEYITQQGKLEAYCETGEFFVGGATTEELRCQLMVQPVVAVWVDEDEEGEEL